MKKWFDYQVQNQRHPEYKLGSASSAIANVSDSMQEVFHHIFKIYPTPQVTRKVEKVFSRDCKYVDSLSPNVPELDQETLEDWIYDPVYDTLLNRPSHEVVYFHDESDRDLLLTTFCQSLDISSASVKSGLGSVKLHVQHPGQIFALHFDRPQHFDFDQQKKSITNQPVHTRFLVFMQDQQPGQVFQMDHDYITWKQGDVFTWDSRNTMHGSSNLGFWPRFMLMFTLKLD